MVFNKRFFFSKEIFFFLNSLFFLFYIRELTRKIQICFDHFLRRKLNWSYHQKKKSNIEYKGQRSSPEGFSILNLMFRGELRFLIFQTNEANVTLEGLSWERR